MKKLAIAIVCILLAGCIGPHDRAMSSFNDIVSSCSAKSIKYKADAEGATRTFVMSCEVSP